jgi:hypothetical protein
VPVTRLARVSTPSVAALACTAAGRAIRRRIHGRRRPDTLLFTSAFAEEPLVTAAPLFLDNEFSVSADVNRFVDLARARNPIASLDEATGGKRAAGARWREIMAAIRMTTRSGALVTVHARRKIAC